MGKDTVEKCLEEYEDVLAEISRDRHYAELRDMIKREDKGKEKWNMCKIAESLERKGWDRGMSEGKLEGRTEGILAMIRDNLEMGQEKDKILDKLVRFFSIRLENAKEFYEMAVVE